jgi:adenine phosphoribosyltransferase
MSQSVYHLCIKGFDTDLPILALPSGIKIAFFNLHGNTLLTEHCGKEIAKLVKGCDIVLTAESKGLQLAHVVARELGQAFYGVCRKSKKLYMQDGISADVQSITTGDAQTLYLSKHDADLLKGKKVAIVDDVVSTGGSLAGLEKIVEMAGGIIYKKAFVLAEGDAADRADIVYLDKIPLL